MIHPTWRRAFKYAGWLAASITALTAVEVVAALNGPDEHFINPTRAPVRLNGTGPTLKFAVVGDSTAAGQGTDVDSGIGILSAKYLAGRNSVEFVNFGISGARISDVVRDQLPVVERFHPDIVLLAVGANDGTHFTRRADVISGLNQIVSGLQSANKGVRIVMTGSPDLSGATRFMQPLRWFAGTQSDRINNCFGSIIARPGIIFAPISDVTGPIFRKDPTLLSADRFHPNKRGYATWMVVISEALQTARNQATQR